MSAPKVNPLDGSPRIKTLERISVDEATAISSEDKVDMRYAKAAAVLTMLGSQAKSEGEHEQARAFMEHAQVFRERLSFAQKARVSASEHNAFPNGRYGKEGA